MTAAQVQGSRATPEVTVVVPVLNEAENFPRFYASLCRHIDEPFRVVVVYDSEGDSTVPVARRLASTDGRVMLLKNPGSGVASALRAGLGYASEGAVIVSMADLSDDHAKITEMLRLYRDGCDVVAASRYCPGGRQIGGPIVKRILSQAAGLSLYALGALPTCDPTNSFKLYSARLLRQVEIESSHGFAQALELTVKAQSLGMRIGEVPARWEDRVAGRSNFKLLRWLPVYLQWYTFAIRQRWHARATHGSVGSAEQPQNSV